jgi:hypothetical protein
MCKKQKKKKKKKKKKNYGRLRTDPERWASRKTELCLLLVEWI